MLVFQSPGLTARTSSDENVSMDLHHFFHRHSTPNVKIIHVLRHQQKLVCMPGKSCDCLVRGVRLRLADPLPPLAIPVPNELRIARECFRRCKFGRIKIPPVTLLTAKSRDAALRRNTGASQNEDSHNLKSTGNGDFQIKARSVFG